MEEFPTSKKNFWQQCPLSILSTWFIIFPTPVTWGWKLRVCNQHLSPSTTSLVRSSLSMVNQHCLCWVKFIDCSNVLVNNCWLALFTECSLLVLSYSNTSPLGDKVSMLTHIYPHKAWRKIEVTICKITRLTAHFMCGLMSDLLICTCL